LHVKYIPLQPCKRQPSAVASRATQIHTAGCYNVAITTCREVSVELHPSRDILRDCTFYDIPLKAHAGLFLQAKPAARCREKSWLWLWFFTSVFKREGSTWGGGLKQMCPMLQLYSRSAVHSRAVFVFQAVNSLC